MIDNPAILLNQSWKADRDRHREFEWHCPRERSNSHAGHRIVPKKWIIFAIVSWMALFQWGFVVHPTYALSSGIIIQNFAFSPQATTISTGDTVVWTNNDPIIYTLWFTNSSDGSTYLFSPPINPGTSWTHTFSDTLTLNYYDFDRLHITGQLIMVSAPASGVGGGHLTLL